MERTKWLFYFEKYIYMYYYHVFLKYNNSMMGNDSWNEIFYNQMNEIVENI